jgi:hypothetical protein
MLLRDIASPQIRYLHPAVRWPLADGARCWDGETNGGAWLWSLEARWWLEVVLGSDGEGGELLPRILLDGMPVPSVRLLDGVASAVEVLPGAVIETGAAQWIVEREADDPPAPRAEGRLPHGEPPRLGPDEALDAFTRWNEDYAEAALVLVKNAPGDVRFREAFQRAAIGGSPAISSAGIRGLTFLASRGLVEADAARKAIAKVKDTAPLELRMAAAQALAGFDALTAGPRLLALVREAFVEGELGSATVECARLLVSESVGQAALREELLRDAQAVAADATARKRRVSAARVLGELANAGEGRALRVLRSLVADPHESVRLAVVRACAPLGGAALDVLIDGAGDADERVRTDAFHALRRLPEAAPRVLAAIDATPPGDRRDHLYAALERLTD